MTNRDAQPKQATPDNPPKPTDGPPLKSGEPGDKKKWDLIDENAWESFPASDPPASWAGRDIPPDEREAQADKPADEKDEKSAEKR